MWTNERGSLFIGFEYGGGKYRLAFAGSDMYNGRVGE